MPLIRKNPPPVQGSESKGQASPVDVSALGKALAAEADPRERAAILTRLVKIGSPEAARAIMAHIGSDDASLRTAALDALRAMPASAAACLSDLLVNADPDVRLLACELVRVAPGPDPARLLHRMLEFETEANICAAAIEVLAEIGGPEALPVLARCAERFAAEPFLVFSIKVAADRIGAENGSSAGPRIG